MSPKTPQTIKLNVSTSALKSLLADDPNTLVAIEKYAFEKIAEELSRKVDIRIGNLIGGSMDTKVHAVIAKTERDLKDRFRFPQEAKDVIARLVQDAVSRETTGVAKQVKSIIELEMERMKSEINKHATAAMQKEFEQLVAMNRKHAREQFLAVMTEIKQGL